LKNSSICSTPLKSPAPSSSCRSLQHIG
jgi:hypothetical protein